MSSPAEAKQIKGFHTGVAEISSDTTSLRRGIRPILVRDLR